MKNICFTQDYFNSILEFYLSIVLFILRKAVLIFFLECPAGYFGLSCSQTCVLPSYGIACSETCNITCLICHHVQGCISSLESTGTVFFGTQLSI